MKVYIVIEYGGEWEDSWEHISGVCSSLELAEKLVEKIKQAHSGPESISRDRFDELYNAVCDYELKYDISLGDMPEAMLKLFPEYSKEEIDKAIATYDSFNDWHGVEIKTEDLLETESELTPDKWK